MKNPLVRKQMPLLKADFSAIDCEKFLTSENRIWKEPGFSELRLNSVQVLFPTTRTLIKGLSHLGFVNDKEAKKGNEKFIRYASHRYY